MAEDAPDTESGGAGGNRAPSRRMRDLAFIVPAFGALALAPPLVGLFARPGIAPFGIPLIVVYLFGLWLALILATMILSRRLRAGDPGGEGG